MVMRGVGGRAGGRGVFGCSAAGGAPGKGGGWGQSGILAGAGSSGVAVAAGAAVLVPGHRRLTPRLVSLGLIVIVGTDLWLNARQFWLYTKPFARDQVINRVSATPAPYRVFQPPGAGAPYHGSILMSFDIPELFGYHGNELRFYDELWGGKNETRNLGVLPLWDLWGVRYAILPAGGRTIDSIPGLHRVLDSSTTFDGARVNLFEPTSPSPYARIVPAAIKVDSAALIPTLRHPRMDFSRIALLTNDQPSTLQ